MPDTQEATTAEVADVLDRAADEVIDRGWCRGRPMDAEGHVCVYGAIGVAAGVELQRHHVPDYYAITDHPLARKAVYFMVGRERGFAWNDGTAEDEYEVADELRRAAKDLRNGEVA